MHEFSKFKLPSQRTFTDSILPELMNKLYKSLDNKLIDSENVSFMSDIWTNRQMLDLIGLAASTINIDFKRETIVIGMTLMPGNHCAEFIQKAIEQQVNRYDFDKTKIIGISSDEGSAYVRLFKQVNKQDQNTFDAL